jgi:hypothetical protein
MTIFIREKTKERETHDLYLLGKKQNIKQNWTYQQISLSAVTLQRLQQTRSIRKTRGLIDL